MPFLSTRKALCMTVAVLWSASALAQFAKPKDAVEYREAGMTLISSHFGRMAPVMRDQQPYDKAAIKANVDTLKMLATLPWAGFASNAPGGDALPKIWSDAAGFKQQQDKFTGNIAKLSAAADAGDLAQLKVAFGAVGESCKSCHNAYRNQD
jgi:cytochrome c556